MKNVLAFIFGICKPYLFFIYPDIKIKKIESYLKTKKLNYVRHRLVKKTYNPNFEDGDDIITSLRFAIHHYEIDATDVQGNPLTVEAIYYQSFNFLRKNRIYFNIKER